MAQSEESSSRFWEFYALRYSVGAVLGALIIFLLVKKNNSLSELIFLKPGEPIDIIQVGIFLGLGLVYSYLSSAPILVLHAGRFLIPKQPRSIFSSSGTPTVAYFAFNLALSISFFFISPIPSEFKPWFSLVFFLASTILTGQIIIIFKCQSQRSKLFLFYKNLATNRSYAKGGIVDSYRHLREHGNAFGIVFLEIILALFMFASTMYMTLSNSAKPPGIFELSATLAVVLLIWITPAILVWFIGCIVEQEFVDS